MLENALFVHPIGYIWLSQRQPMFVGRQLAVSNWIATCFITFYCNPYFLFGFKIVCNILFVYFLQKNCTQLTVVASYVYQLHSYCPIKYVHGLHQSCKGKLHFTHHEGQYCKRLSRVCNHASVWNYTLQHLPMCKSSKEVIII